MRLVNRGRLWSLAEIPCLPAVFQAPRTMHQRRLEWFHWGSHNMLQGSAPSSTMTIRRGGHGGRRQVATARALPSLGFDQKASSVMGNW